MIDDFMRTFFAIDLPSSTKQIINDQIILMLKKSITTQSIRWTKKDSLHLTLHFLKTVRMTDIKKLIENVQAELEEERSFHLEFGGLELFPTQHQPRIISLSIQPNDSLIRLVKKIGDGIVKSDYSIESRPFRGHITLGRLNKAAHSDLSFSEEPILKEGILVSEVVLFESKPTDEESNYSSIAQIRLKNKHH
jgi:2'-5' RNA ligase